MAMQHQEKQDRDQEKQERQQRNALIGKNVLHALGQPADLLKVQVRPLWENHYRVNVLVGVDAASTKVAHSTFWWLAARETSSPPRRRSRNCISL